MVQGRKRLNSLGICHLSSAQSVWLRDAKFSVAWMSPQLATVTAKWGEVDASLLLSQPRAMGDANGRSGKRQVVQNGKAC